MRDGGRIFGQRLSPALQHERKMVSSELKASGPQMVTRLAKISVRARPARDGNKLSILERILPGSTDSSKGYLHFRTKALTLSIAFCRKFPWNSAMSCVW
jgi:hypothetical protein